MIDTFLLLRAASLQYRLAVTPFQPTMQPHCPPTLTQFCSCPPMQFGPVNRLRSICYRARFLRNHLVCNPSAQAVIPQQGSITNAQVAIFRISIWPHGATPG